MRRLRTVLAVLALLAASTVAIGSAVADTFNIGNLVIEVDGDFTPTKLPKKEPAPITLHVEGDLGTSDGTHPPALKTLKVDFDKAGHLNTNGLATCTVGKLISTLTAQAKKVCGAALIGSGRVSADIALPEQAPFGASGPLLIFNGAPKGGKQVLIFHVHANVPAPTTFVTTALISKTAGKFGTTALIQIPTITSGQGSLTGFEATLKKSWVYKGKKEDLLLASCPAGSLRAHAEFSFANGDKGSGEFIKPCTPTG